MEFTCLLHSFNVCLRFPPLSLLSDNLPIASTGPKALDGLGALQVAQMFERGVNTVLCSGAVGGRE